MDLPTAVSVCKRGKRASWSKANDVTEGRCFSFRCFWLFAVWICIRGQMPEPDYMSTWQQKIWVVSSQLYHVIQKEKTVKTAFLLWVSWMGETPPPSDWQAALQGGANLRLRLKIKPKTSWVSVLVQILLPLLGVHILLISPSWCGKITPRIGG